MTRLRREMYNYNCTRNSNVDNDTDKYLTTYGVFEKELTTYAKAEWNIYKQEQKAL